MAHDIDQLAIGVTVPFVVICVLSFVVRIYARKCIAHSFGADDWMMVAAFIVWIGQQCITYAWVVLGAGKHESEVPAHNVKLIQRYLFAEEFLYLGLQLMIKLSFLLFYLRFLGTTRWRIAIFATMGLVCAQVVGTWIFYGLQCIPIQAYFYPDLYPNAKCLTVGLAYYMPSAINVLVDVVIYTLPIPALCSLQTSSTKRLRAISIMTLGGCTILVSLLRFIVLYQLATSPDFTYIFGRVVIVTTIEFVSAIFTANMPAMSTAYKRHISDPTSDFPHELGKFNNDTNTDTTAAAAQGFGQHRSSSRLAALRKTGPAAIPLSRNKASISSSRGETTKTRSSSPTDSEAELVKSPGVVVERKWRIESEDVFARQMRGFSRSPEPLRLRGDV